MPIDGDTVIDKLLMQFSDLGVKTVFITVSRFGPLIRSYCGDGSRWGLESSTSPRTSRWARSGR
jgi:mannose-1-phosphate guanylyltransferase